MGFRGSGVVRGLYGGVYGGISCTKKVQSQEIIIPEASTKKRVRKQEPILRGSFRPTFKNDVSPTRNHCFHKCHQAFENHEIGVKGWTFGFLFVMKMQMLGGFGGVKMALRWRYGGVTVALRWRFEFITKIATRF